MNYKNKANMTLVVVFVMFIATAILKYFYGEEFLLNLLFAIEEASLVGGAADWFAITALFEKPLNISFHTAIIPRNRTKIIAGITEAVEKQLLTKELVREKISQINLAKITSNLIMYNKNKILYYIEGEINKYITNNGKDKLIELLKQNNIIQSNKDKIVDKIIDEALQLCKYEKLQLFIYEALLELKKEKVDNFFARLSFDFLEKTDSVNLHSAAQKFCSHLLMEITNMKNEDNEYRKILDVEIEGLLEEVHRQNEEVEHILEVLKDSIDTSKITTYIVSELHKYFLYLIEDEQFNKALDNILKEAMILFAEKNHSFLGEIVRETLNEYDDKKLNEFIEDKFGDDLQWIRINGSVVGGMLGGCMFLFLTFFYNPIVVPVIRRFILH